MGTGVSAQKETVSAIDAAWKPPRDYVTTTSDELNRRCVMDLLGHWKACLPGGTAGQGSEGLLTADQRGSNFLNGIMHPSRHIKQTYHCHHPSGCDRENNLSPCQQHENWTAKMTQPAAVCGKDKEARDVVSL